MGDLFKIIISIMILQDYKNSAVILTMFSPCITFLSPDSGDETSSD